MMKLDRIRRELGTAGLAAIALIALALAFSGFVTRPLEEKNQLLQDRGSRKSQAAQPGAEKVAAVYEYLAKAEEPTDWLAKLHGISVATGVQVKSASYKALPMEGLIERTEIVLPVSGSYAQIRDFLKRSQAEIPVMSIDQINLRRVESGDRVQAEMRLTLHMVKP